MHHPTLILDLPTEVMIGIIRSCGSFKQALALISTCKQLRLLWETFSTSMVSYIGWNAIPAFDDALMAVRATEHAAVYYTHLVHVAKGLATISPPPPSRVSINTLISGGAAKASIYEAKKVLELKLFVDYSLYLSHHPSTATHLACLTQKSTSIPLPTECEHRQGERERVDRGGRSAASTSTEDGSHESDEGGGDHGYTEEECHLEALVYGGMYNFFTISAILTNRYYEPFFTRNQIATSLREGYEIFWPREVSDDPYIAAAVDSGAPGIIDENTERLREYYLPMRQLKDEEVEYLMQWDVFNKTKFREMKQGGLAEAFDEIADYFCERAKKRIKNIPKKNITPDTGTGTAKKEEEEYLFDISTAAEIQQMMILNNCYEVWMRMRERMDSLVEPVRLTHEKLLYALNRDDISLTTIPVVFHAIYGVGDAMMPSTIEDFRSHSYGPVPPNLQGHDSNGQPLKHTEVSDVIYQLICKVGQELGDPGPGEDGGDAVRRYFEFGWSEYAFWEWVMNRKFGMRVNWKWAYVDIRYDNFVRYGKAFGGIEQFRKEIPGVVVRLN
ncbi:hypothetical protein TWF102_000499 [Orbilia oligospora]|uniref:F-box domain-containing protein n=1 Tax=Orbilia oligospora TaxID=2813651 RepID=A0A7C8N8W5_ORBOL|nr:hypothetical protein TWF102_000499 [Orbilia oligospora]KAF3097106.1 hypothetical protein TWF103_009632 [Orbilia oligospora]KAF3141843.1 hypothetical protein TWF594_005900 [Orbilia oligospora]